MYHGTQDERAEMRRTVLRPPITDSQGSRPKKPIKNKGRKSGTKRRHPSEEEEDLGPQDPWKYPIVCTTYDIIIRDTSYLANLVPGRAWQFIVVDEGHRLKNMDCRHVLSFVGHHEGY